ncbi:glycosyltransferase family protein [Loigolactobacillus jiayinensis]|uniref:Integral membrane protein n=1 Tax=Loigolactobacillus jiayinensis TaxID=2486016 RepID=A0ABW1RDI4_9LACO|nr:hypothetical protein [Loigolactobacillus jiayinensis]
MLEHRINLALEWVMFAVMALVFGGALLSPNLNPQLLAISVLVVLLVGGAYWWLRQRPHLKAKLSWPQGWRFLRSKWCLAVVAIVYQITLVYGLASDTGFDTGIVRWAASTKSIVDGSYLSNYFSNNPNNLGLMFAERGVYHLTQFFGLTNFLIVLVIINLILVDLAIILIGLTLRHYLQRRVVWLLLPAIFLLTPWILLVYSDTVILPFVAGSIFLLDRLLTQSRTQQPLRNSLGLALLFGVVFWGAYILKPSALILGIAVALELALVAIFNYRRLDFKRLAILLAAGLVSFGLCQMVSQHALQQQTFVPLHDNLTELPSHYIMMGMNKGTTGSYSQSDFLYSTKFTTKKAQQSANIKVIKQRLHKFGFGGYLKFLVVKNYANTSDGTLGWLFEGEFFSKPNLKQHAFLRSFYYPFGTRLRYYHTFAQLIWIILLAGVLLSFWDQAFFARSLRLAFFGLLLFLLLFEGGRSRYMIQFMPVIYSLSVIGWFQLPPMIAAYKNKRTA